MKISEVLRKAAMEKLWDGKSPYSFGMYTCSCGAIFSVDKENFKSNRNYYAMLLKPENIPVDREWFKECILSDRQKMRFMALLFAAECAESEGR